MPEQLLRTYGDIHLQGGFWKITADPHVLTKLKRVFDGIHKYDLHDVSISNTPANCVDLEWFLMRYPMKNADIDELISSADEFRATLNRLDEITKPGYQHREYDLAIPLRDYQAEATEIYMEKKSLLLADDIGVGKTAVAIGSLVEKGTLPAIVVTLTHLTKQWEREINRFAPQLTTHIIKKGTPYPLPEVDGRGPDVLIVNYHKLRKWPAFLWDYVNSIVFDEIQELRRKESKKYEAAASIARECEYRLGLTATPVYNYGGEIFNVIQVLSPWILGSRAEFHREWCAMRYGDKPSIIEPKAFGSFLRENFIMLRRTRHDVDRELPSLSIVKHAIDSDSAELHKVAENATELARIIIQRIENATPQQQFVARGQFDMVMRQATGLAKAPYVADFVRIMVENGEKVVLYGWHREVYEIWKDKLRDLNPVMYTGSESPNQKMQNAQEFIDGNSDVIIISLRSGAGLDGLQYSGCRTVVFGELDWSPGVTEQCTGRVHRDGQPDPVVAYYLVSDEGADPIMSEILGIKNEQIQGIRDPNLPFAEKIDPPKKSIADLAREYLEKT